MRKTVVGMLGMIAAMSVLAVSVQAQLVIHEPFAQDAGSINGQPASSFGLTGNWIVGGGSANVVTPSTMIFEALEMSDGQVDLLSSGNSNARVIISDDLSNAGLLEDGATLWFSFLFEKESGGGVNEHSGFAFGSSHLIVAHNGVGLDDEGHAFGFLTRNTSIRVTKWTGTSRQNAGNGGTGAFSLDDLNTPTLIVGRIEWGEDGDPATEHTITLYKANADLTLGTGTEWSVDYFDQSTFDTISFAQRNSGGAQTYNEFRFGATAEDVLPVYVTPPSVTIITIR